MKPDHKPLPHWYPFTGTFGNFGIARNPQYIDGSARKQRRSRAGLTVGTQGFDEELDDWLVLKTS